MKTLKFFSFIACLLGAVCLSAQKQEAQQLVQAYYLIKDALVESDANRAGTSAAALVKLINQFPAAALASVQAKSWKKNSPAILKSAEVISQTTDIEKQREHFKALSTQLFVIMKSLRINDDDIFWQYCPMKDAYWMSSEREIRNPYYGSRMLKCGQIKETLN